MARLTRVEVGLLATSTVALVVGVVTLVLLIGVRGRLGPVGGVPAGGVPVGGVPVHLTADPLGVQAGGGTLLMIWAGGKYDGDVYLSFDPANQFESEPSSVPVTGGFGTVALTSKPQVTSVSVTIRGLAATNPGAPGRTQVLIAAPPSP